MDIEIRDRRRNCSHLVIEGDLYYTATSVDGMWLYLNTGYAIWLSLDAIDAIKERLL